MLIGGMDVYMGAYAERNQSSFQFNQDRLILSEERSQVIMKGIKEAYASLNLQSKEIRTTISKENMDFLCSEEGFQKIKSDAEKLYVVNANQQKEIAVGRNPQDLFWKNTGNQWLILSEMLNKNGFFDDMDQEEVKTFEDTLSFITSGMDRFSRSQYNTGLDFSSFDEEYKYFMTESEALMELESSTAALKHLSDKMIPAGYKEEFDKMINMYHAHNEEIISEYINPMESFNRIVAGINAAREKNPSILEPIARKPVEEYKYTVMLGKVSKSSSQKKEYQNELQGLFNEYGIGKKDFEIWAEIRDKYIEYASDVSNDEGLKMHVYKEANYLFEHIRKVWEMMENLVDV